MAIKDVLVPDVGGDEVEVIELCVAVGDTVEAEDSLITVESDKASMDIPAPFAGTIKEIKIAVGDKVSEGTLIVTVEAAGESASESEAQAEPEQAQAAPQEAEKAAPQAGGSSVIEVKVPDIGGDTDVEVIEVLVAVGDEVAAEDGLITLETDKATMDVPCPAAGIVKELKIAVGDKASEGTLVLLLETAGGEAPAEQSAPAATEQAAPAAESAPAASEMKEVKVPDIGGDTDVDIIEILVAVGDEIEAEAGLITLETDKATMDVPAPFAGTVKEIKVAVGDKVSEGSLIVLMETKGSAPQPVAEKAASAPAPEKAAPAPAKAEPAAAVAPSKPSKNVHASPSVRRTAREFGVDLTLVPATGPKGRILKEDVQNWVKAELAKPKSAAGSAPAGDNVLQIVPVKPIDHSKFGEVEEKELSRITKISGPFLHRNWATIPHVTQFDEADITDLEAFRKAQNDYHAKKQTGLKITPLVFIMKAVAKALEKFPNFNSSLSEDGGSLIVKKFINIGIAVATPGGLVVPVIRDVNKKGIEELSEELIVVSKKARAGQLKAADMQGGTFTISSLGGIGGTAFTPIVNAPEVGILGVSKSDFKPKWNGKEFEPRLMVPLSLSYDHRVIDGAEGAAFSTEIAQNLTDLRRLVL
ncbi:pyruvate dehydrogenase complex dihydrolipoyllysine-residue acetyltransferase [Catenovulum sp. 2E275]|uniref:pyruvate dehydrogenase complex dihydrolipoyllysine-residue acetyltransferase n=1 Tax=Catenovulum sp. 2E275 TaxID=2980497 RepID=UPI0021CF786E|nr:pyruvate dehydrogenase complex dihydrolipoyllysine-residue acetyltransferase [Catenovulum sp. 2E275]MCU4674256.1 pyruvate dehydrogenase complex dihydrolipoyllysine-residue acetyltransferase [Catenovulum sp. 2E275]